MTPRFSMHPRLRVLIAHIIGRVVVSTPQRLAELADSETPHAEVFVSVTKARVRPGQRRAFNALTLRLHASLNNHPGVICHSIRRELFGNQAWTLTVWASAQARDHFVFGPMHLEAMQLSRQLLSDVRVGRLTIRRDELPLIWSQALSLLKNEPEGEATLHGR